jgi:plastocyanin
LPILKMKFSTALATLAALVAPALATNITVIVGAAEDGSPALTFRPNQITAQVGDFVSFQFRGGNHTVTQSSFANPCTQQLNTVTNQPGFTSPFIPFSNTSGTIGVYTLEVTQTSAPIWFFCARKGHCNGGMVGAINAPTSGEKSFTVWAQNAKTANEAGFGNTAPFTPPSSNGNPGSSTIGLNTGILSTQTNTGLTPSQTTSGATSISARSGAVVALAGVVAALVL